MPIKFRCPHCRQFLGISRSKAGELADCPMCGKTLRVPNVDGSVAPLPKPELNLQDSSLVDALGELASIGSTGRSSMTVESPADPQTPAPSRSPQPITLEPLVPAQPVPATSQPKPSRRPNREKRSKPSPQETASSISADDATIDDPRVPVSEGNSSAAFNNKSPRNKKRTSRNWVPIAIAVGLFLTAGAGLVAMMNGGRSARATAAEQSDEEPVANAAIAPASDERIPAVTGRITYVSDAGDSRPDDGAKVIALPAERRGTVMFDATGFMVGSADIDAQVAAASIRALGGDLTTANDRGEYTLHMLDAGSYELLVISRHQSRPWEVSVEGDIQEMLARFFIRPSTLLGQLAYDIQSFQYRGQGTSPRDVAFGRQN